MKSLDTIAEASMLDVESLASTRHSEMSNLILFTTWLIIIFFMFVIWERDSWSLKKHPAVKR